MSNFCSIRLLDIAFNCLFLTPLAILWWSGTWRLLDSLITPDQSVKSRIISVVFGSIVSCLGYLLKAFLSHRHTHLPRTIHLFLHYLLIYVHSLGGINFWRGVWDLRDIILKHYVESQSLTNASAILVCIIFLALLIFRSVANCSSLPLSCVHDYGIEHRQPKPKYRTEVQTCGPCLFIFIPNSVVLILQRFCSYENMCGLRWTFSSR